jgi:glycosyltransferase involved in cell wall biosynthesis
MKISICIPQYNRIEYLLKSLKIIESQNYADIEIVISDDCSTDDTVEKISALITSYKYPIIFSVNSVNEGFDRNYRKCIELSTGEYALVIGNDDSINGNDSIGFLVDFLTSHNLPEIGFCNCIEERLDNQLMERAHSTGVLGTGTEIALKHYSCFSFVGGLIYKKSAFDQYNTSKHDGSIYAQMYLGCLMVANGCRLFSIKEPLVIKDLLFEGEFRNSYRDRIAKSWKNFKVVTGGLPSVINVLVSSFIDAGKSNQSIVFRIHQRIYSVTYPFWIQDYKSNGALPEAAGLILGLNPSKLPTYYQLGYFNRVRLWALYLIFSTGSLLFPSFLFQIVKTRLYKHFKK